MLAALSRLQHSPPLDIEVVDIDRDPALVQRFGDSVPVLAAGENVLYRFRLDHDALRDYLAGVERARP
jgi:hypothetical protein